MNHLILFIEIDFKAVRKDFSDQKKQDRHDLINLLIQFGSL